MSRTVKLILMGALMLALAAGAALAAAPLICPSGGGLCVGTPEADTITGSGNVAGDFRRVGMSICGKHNWQRVNDPVNFRCSIGG